MKFAPIFVKRISLAVENICPWTVPAAEKSNKPPVVLLSASDANPL
jgi:hypothetical protein